MKPGRSCRIPEWDLSFSSGHVMACWNTITDSGIMSVSNAQEISYHLDNDWMPLRYATVYHDAISGSIGWKVNR